MSRRYLLYTAINAFIVVALGAFGAHALEARLSEASLQTWQTAVQYQMFHTIGLFAVASLARHFNSTALRWSGRLFVAGIVLFCCSLYMLALTGLKQLGAVTPIGGLAWLIAWALLAKAASTQKAA